MKKNRKENFSTGRKEEEGKGKAKVVSFTERPVAVYPPKKKLKVGESASSAEEKDKYGLNGT